MNTELYIVKTQQPLIKRYNNLKYLLYMVATLSGMSGKSGKIRKNKKKR